MARSDPISRNLIDRARGYGLEGVERNPPKSSRNMRGSVVKQSLETALLKTVTKRAPLAAAALVLFLAAATNVEAQVPIVDYQPAYVANYYPYAAPYYAVSPYPAAYYAYPTYAFPAPITSYSVGYSPYALPPAYVVPTVAVPTVAYTVGPYAVGFYSYAGYPTWVSPGWAVGSPYGFGH
jgi:hypothetical protein